MTSTARRHNSGLLVPSGTRTRSGEVHALVRARARRLRYRDGVDAHQLACQQADAPVDVLLVDPYATGQQ